VVSELTLQSTLIGNKQGTLLTSDLDPSYSFVSTLFVLVENLYPV